MLARDALLSNFLCNTGVNSWSLDTKQLSHGLLCQPDGFIPHHNINLDVLLWRIIDKELQCFAHGLPFNLRARLVNFIHGNFQLGIDLNDIHHFLIFFDFMIF